MTWTTRPRSEVGGLAAIAAGQGPNILLLHGVGLRAEAWGAQIDALAQVARVAAPDMPGHGDSPLISEAQSIDDYAEVAHGVLRALDGPALVVGHSMGAMLAVELARRAPDLVRGVVALNAVFERSDAAARAVQGRAADLDGRTQVDPSVTLTRWFDDADTPERRACAQWLTACDPAAYKLAYTAFAQSHLPTRPTLRALRCPALFMTGAEEPNSTPDMSRTMASLTPNGRALIEPGAAHMLPMTHPDAVNTALHAMLADVFSEAISSAPERT